MRAARRLALTTMTVASVAALPSPEMAADSPRPQLTNPQTVTLAQSGTVNLSPPQDYILRQDQPCTGNLRINGGNDVLWVGGECRINRVPDSATSDFRYARRGPQTP